MSRPPRRLTRAQAIGGAAAAAAAAAVAAREIAKGGTAGPALHPARHTYGRDFTARPPGRGWGEEWTALHYQRLSVEERRGRVRGSGRPARHGRRSAHARVPDRPRLLRKRAAGDVCDHRPLAAAGGAAAPHGPVRVPGRDDRARPDARLRVRPRAPARARGGDGRPARPRTSSCTCASARTGGGCRRPCGARATPSRIRSWPYRCRPDRAAAASCSSIPRRFGPAGCGLRSTRSEATTPSPRRRRWR